MTDDPDDDILMIIAYLRKLGTVATAERPVGNVDNGARLFTAQCASCHRVAGRGGRIGPDLTRIGIARSRAALVREIRTPSEWMPPAFETVTLVTKDGQRIRGTKKNEDVFSIQIMDTRERIQGYLKSNLQEVIYEKTSLMPAFPAGRLNDSDLTDLVGYLGTLRGADQMRPVRSRRHYARFSDDHPVLVSVALAAQTGAPLITSQDLLDGLKDPTRWLTYRGDYNGQRHSPLTQITPENVNQLTAQWTFQTGTTRKLSDDAARRRRRAVRHRLQQQRLGDRRAVRAHDLALPARAAGGSEAVLRRRESRVRRARRSAVHDDDRRASASRST